MSDYKLTANVRNDVGKGASRRLRRADKVPAIFSIIEVLVLLIESLLAI